MYQRSGITTDLFLTTPAKQCVSCSDLMLLDLEAHVVVQIELLSFS